MRAGLTNEYLINTGAPAALRYNDRSVNENGHCALGFEILLKRSNNFLEVRASPCLRPDPGPRAQAQGIIIRCVYDASDDMSDIGCRIFPMSSTGL